MLSRSLLFCALASVVSNPEVGPTEPFSNPSRPLAGALSYLECNRGQSDPSVDFLARCKEYTAWVRSCDVIVALPAATPIVPPHLRDPGAEREPPHVIDLRLVRARERAAIPEEKLPGASNYFIGRDESRWVTGAPHVRRARYADSWPGVEVLWSVEQRRLHVEFEVAAGADPGQIALAVDGASRVAISGDGALRLSVPGGEASLCAPIAFQRDGRLVDVRWEIRADGSAGFALGSYDRGRPLTIDPSLTYSTFLGGSSTEVPAGVAVDASNNAYLGGSTQSSNLPVTSGVYQSNLRGAQDAFCIKLNSSGSALSYCTFVGGSTSETATGLAVDSSGNAFIAGYTSSTDFPTTSGAAATTMSAVGSYSGYVVKLNSTGSARTYSTYVNNGYLLGLALDSSGNAYAATQGIQIGIYKLNSSGTTFSYTKSFGVAYASQERPTGIAVDSSGNAYVAGYTNQSTFPTVIGSYSTTYGGGLADAFVFKLNSTGNVLWSTFLGGGGHDYAQGVALDASGNPWVVGYTTTYIFPTTSNAYATLVAGDEDVFVTKLDTGGASLAYSTLLGGTGVDWGFAIAVRGAYVYVAGGTTSTNFPSLSPFQASHAGGEYDAFLSVFQCDGVLANSTYLGGTSADVVESRGVAADSVGDAYVFARTDSSDFPTQNAYDTTIGVTDGGLAKMTGLFTPFAVNAATLPAWTRGVAFSQAFTTAGAIGATTWSVSAGALPAGLALSAAGTVSGTPTVSGNFTFTLQAVDSCQQSASRQFVLLVNPPPTVDSVDAQTWTRTIPFALALTATGGTAPLAFSVDSGTVPPGLTLDSAGNWSGTPTTAGSFAFDVRVTDLRGATAVRTVSMVVAEIPSIVAQTLADCTENVPYATTFDAVDGTAPLAFSLASGSFPFTAPVDSVTGAVNPNVSAKTRGAGLYQFTLRVTDARGAHSDRDFSMRLNPFPQIDTGVMPIAVAGRGYRVTLHGHGGTSPVTWQLHSALPAGLGLLQSAGVVTGSPTLPGGFVVRLGYEDNCGGVAERALEIGVASPLDLTKHSAKSVATFEELAALTPRYFALEMIEGTSLAVTVSSKQKGDLPVDVALLDPASDPIDLGPFGGRKGKSFKIKGFTVPATGRYVLRLTPVAAFSGSVAVAAVVAAKSTFEGTIHLDGSASPADLRIPVMAGAKLAFTVKGEKHATLVPEIVGVRQDGVDLVAPGEVKGSGTTRTVKLGATLAVGDVHVIVGAAPGTDGDAKWTVHLKLPRTYTFSMADVPVGE